LAIDVEDYYRRFGPMVLRRCRALLREEDRAVDAMHDVFLALLRQESQLQVTAPSSLLYRMATNVCLNQMRTRRRHPEHVDDDLLDRIAATQDLEARSVARGFLERLFDLDQESTATMAVLHLVDGMTLEEVAAQMNMSVSGVRKRLRTLKGRVAELEGV
jgi:RNA polymerase sigma-70 factor (ECF subfamily)